MARAYANYSQSVTLTPQSAPIPGREAEMVPNNAGGFGFKLDDWDRLLRFLILGSEAGTYYVTEQKLTAENASVAIRCIKADGPRTVEMARDVNVNNRAPKTDQQLFVLALALKHGDEATKRAAETVLPDVLRTGTHILHFAAMLDGLGGWSRVKRRVVANWFETREPDKLAYQVLKYQSRDGWSMKDLLRVSHPAAPEGQAPVYDWICGRHSDSLPALLRSHTLMGMGEGDARTKALFGIEHGLPREALPTEALADPVVWRALLPETPPHALLRNLGNLTANGTFSVGGNIAAVCAKLRDPAVLKRARVHPFAIMLASAVYRSGAGVRGGKTWTPERQIIEALDDAYEVAFETVKPTNKRLLIAIDGSGSMSSPCVGTPLSCETAAAMLSLTLARLEPHATVVVFEIAVRQVLPITKRSTLSSIGYQQNPTGTDLAAPIRWAMGQQDAVRTSGMRWGIAAAASVVSVPSVAREFDAFILISDNETWAGHGHATEWLSHYRREVNQRAKLVVCAMAANNANIIDPNDPLQLGIVGLDANLPSIIGEFVGA